APTVVEAVAINGLAVRKAFEALEHHDRRHHRRWYRAPTLVVEQVGELLIGEQAITLTVHERVDRALVEHLVAKLLYIVEQVGLPISQAQGHRSLPVENYLCVILSQLRPDREHYARERHQPPRGAKAPCRYVNPPSNRGSSHDPDGCAILC